MYDTKHGDGKEKKDGIESEDVGENQRTREQGVHITSSTKQETVGNGERGGEDEERTTS